MGRARSADSTPEITFNSSITSFSEPFLQFNKRYDSTILISTVSQYIGLTNSSHHWI